ncbi:MAG TPA: hypothetical protein HA360_00110 [Nanoarchaeota archaeon]|nr:hypothetical protein [Candidatus Woesearchaeota archaeon]HIH15338.1 hypothetical protein [Nanoarchaeota archaeon]HIH59228.1 hypothetical protein [Nanoarchaeota archaeon]HII13457.1 hypothetical protein [Nanoarchaeota archaeon]HIJ05546.1 hypothetical protein [Nanoarchaeota archaeon]
MRSILYLNLLVSCMPKPEIKQETSISFSLEEVQKIVELQSWCKDLNHTFRTRNFIFSEEPILEREDFFKEIKEYFPLNSYPESLEKCIQELQGY